MNEEDNLIGIILKKNKFPGDAIEFKKADALFELGEKLPKPYKAEPEFLTKQKYFSYLVRNSHDLYITLRSNPDIIIKKDENGLTLLHHLALISFDKEITELNVIQYVNLLLYLLLNAPKLDFNIKDNQQNTPLQIAASYCHIELIRNYVFPQYLQRAKELNANFDSLNTSGLAVLHIVATIPSVDGVSCIDTLLKIIPTINLNVLSAAGSTPLYYAANWCDVPNVVSLLKAGANPLAHDQNFPERSPLAMIENYIQECNVALIQEDYKDQIAQLNKRLEDFKEIKKLIVVAINSQKAHKKSELNEKLIFWKKKIILRLPTKVKENNNCNVM